MVGRLGLTGMPFVNVMNGCATAGSALLMACNTIRSGASDIGLVVGFDKHPRGAFDPDPRSVGLGEWYGHVGMMLTTQFFAMKTNRYMHDHGISESTLAKVAAKNFRNGAMNPNAWRQKTWNEDEILDSRMLNFPLRQYMFCSPDEGGAALIVCKAELARQFTDRPVFVDAVTLKSRRFGSFEVFSSWLPLESSESPTVDASRAAYEMAGIGPEDVQVAQIQDSEAGHEVMHMAENGFVITASKKASSRPAKPRSAAGFPSTPTAASSPMVSRSVPRVFARSTRFVCSCAAKPDRDRSRPVRSVGYTQVYGAPGIGCVTILSV